jgi:hypothetical protein
MRRAGGFFVTSVGFCNKLVPAREVLTGLVTICHQRGQKLSSRRRADRLSMSEIDRQTAAGAKAASSASPNETAFLDVARSSSRPGEFMCSSKTVARPVGVNPTTRSPRKLKCSCLDSAVIVPEAPTLGDDSPGRGDLRSEPRSFNSKVRLP